MKKSMLMFSRFFLLGCFIPFVLSTVVYFGFATNYTGGVFSEKGFQRQYESGIYKYRVLGNSVLLKTYRFIKDHHLPSFAPLSLKTLDPDGTPEFYSAYFYVNTLFLCLTSCLMFLLLGGFNLHADFILTDLPLILFGMLLTITQYVVVPYDTLSYFFLALSAWLIIRDDRSPWNAIVLAVVMVMSTLTRETAALTLSFYLAVNRHNVIRKPNGFKLNRHQYTFLALIFSFIVTYVSLRVKFGFEQGFFDQICYKSNLTPLPILGALFFFAFTSLLFLTQGARRDMTVFLFASSPYIVFMLLAAIPWEIRLWTPLFMVCLILKVRAARIQHAPERHQSTLHQLG